MTLATEDLAPTPAEPANETPPRIVDGITRSTICTELGVPIETITLSQLGFDNVDDSFIRDYIYNVNIHRRVLTNDQKVAVTARFYPDLAKEAEQKKSESLIKATAASPVNKKDGEHVDIERSPRDIQAKHANSTVGKMAKMAGVSERKASQAVAVFKADPTRPC
jgi:hypothetical protein